MKLKASAGSQASPRSAFGKPDGRVRLRLPSPQRHLTMTSQGTAHGRFQRAIHRRHVQAAEMAAREMGADALALCELLANTDPARYERAALRWLQPRGFVSARLGRSEFPSQLWIR
jgi:hypothetical protein